ncbi:phosphate/phosphite/phosphonate ABC transporter substrate-binding protein [Streptomyces sp. NPDC054796]
MPRYAFTTQQRHGFPRVRRLLAPLLLLTAMVSCTSGGETRSRNCPVGEVQFGVDPFENAARLIPAYKPLARQLGDRLGCPVELHIPTSYSAEVEAMRQGKLDVAQFGPLGYAFAERLARARVVATYGDSHGRPLTYRTLIVTPSDSGITRLTECRGRSFAYSDAVSTSGRLFPAYALERAGIDPDRGVKPRYAGSHTASYEALRQGKADCGALPTPQIEIAKDAGIYKAGELRTLWRSAPIPHEAVTVRETLPAPFRERVREELLALDLTKIPEEHRGLLFGPRLVAQKETAYDEVRELARKMGLDVKDLDG